MATLRCLSLFKRVVLDETGAARHGLDVGSAIILSDLEEAVTGLEFSSVDYHYSVQLGDTPGKTIAAITLEAPQATIDVAVAHPGVLGLPVTAKDGKAFLRAAGLSVGEAIALYRKDEGAFFESVKAWLNG